MPDTGRLEARHLRAAYGAQVAVRDVSLVFPPRCLTAVVGPSGCGKSTLLRCLNRMHESVEGASVEGAVLLDGEDLYAPGVSAVAARRRIGMVLQQPTPFPTMSIRENVLAGLSARGVRRPSRADQDALVEAVLQRTGLWPEVRDRLGDPPIALSGGQQQRLCVARALALSPTVLLLDEPTAGLDPRNAERLEDLLVSLRGEITIVLVTHNLQQAARASDRAAFLLDGALVEAAPTSEFFTRPRDPRTEAYVTGRAA